MYGKECEKFFDKYNDIIEEKINAAKNNGLLNETNHSLASRQVYTAKLNKLDMACEILEELFEIEMPARALIKSEKQREGFNPPRVPRPSGK